MQISKRICIRRSPRHRARSPGPASTASKQQKGPPERALLKVNERTTYPQTHLC